MDEEEQFVNIDLNDDNICSVCKLETETGTLSFCHVCFELSIEGKKLDWGAVCLLTGVRSKQVLLRRKLSSSHTANSFVLADVSKQPASCSMRCSSLRFFSSPKHVLSMLFKS